MKCTAGKSSWPWHAEQRVTWKIRGAFGSDSSWISLRFLAVSARYDAMRAWSCTRPSRKSAWVPEPEPTNCARTYRLGVLLVGEELPLEVFANESEARRVVLAQELHDLDRRHDPPLVDLVEDLDHVGLMPREELGRTRQVGEDESVQGGTGGTVSS